MRKQATRLTSPSRLPSCVTPPALISALFISLSPDETYQQIIIKSRKAIDRSFKEGVLPELSCGDFVWNAAAEDT